MLVENVIWLFAIKALFLIYFCSVLEGPPISVLPAPINTYFVIEAAISAHIPSD